MPCGQPAPLKRRGSAGSLHRRRGAGGDPVRAQRSAMFSLTATRSHEAARRDTEQSLERTASAAERSVKQKWGIVIRLAPVRAVLPLPLLASLSQAMAGMPESSVEIGAYVEASLRTSASPSATASDWHSDLSQLISATVPPEPIAMPPK
eukprot:6510093-Prymnesium_polylepis.1